MKKQKLYEEFKQFLETKNKHIEFLTKSNEQLREELVSSLNKNSALNFKNASYRTIISNIYLLLKYDLFLK